jgi:signal transduction histidine kinase
VVRTLAIVLALAIVAVVTGSLVLARGPRPEEVGDPRAALASLGAPRAVIDIGERYAGREELLDPRRALPTWHLFPRDQAAALFSATRTCPPLRPAIPLDDAALAKAYAWHERTCSPGAPVPAELLQRPPFMHPSGRSYAALAAARGEKSDPRTLHVLELTEPEPAALGSRAWDAIAKGDRIVLLPSSLVLVDHGPLGLTKIRIYTREDWDRVARAASLALVPRGSGCASPASSALCFQPLSSLDRHRDSLARATTAGAALAVATAIALAIAYAAERRRVHADRIHVLRTLTHELRTPAMSLGLDIEPFRAAYDELPASLQEPALRLSDGIARLGRVLHESARYMALFETRSGAVVRFEQLPSIDALMRELAEEWPEGVALEARSADGPIRTDPSWLGVVLRNLVTNAVRHGKRPVVVTWKCGGTEIVIRVTDTGTTPRFSLRRASLPYHRDPASPGLGLGLAIVARATRLLHGTLAHEPSPTVFQITMPVDPGEMT